MIDPTPPHRGRTTVRAAYASIAVATLVFGLNPSLFRMVDLDVPTILWCVNGITVAALLLKLAVFGGLGRLLTARRRPWELLGLVFATTVNNILFIAAVQQTTVANATLSHYCAPIFVLLLGTVVVGERIGRRSLASLAIAFLGLAIMVAPHKLTLADQHVVGILLGTSSALFFALEILLKKRLRSSLDAEVIVVLYVLGSAIVLTPFASPERLADVGARGLASLFVSGVVVSAVGLAVFMRGLRHVPAQKAAIIGYLEPLSGIAWGAILVLDFPDVGAMVGGAAILVAIWITIAGPRAGRAGPQADRCRAA